MVVRVGKERGSHSTSSMSCPFRIRLYFKVYLGNTLGETGACDPGMSHARGRGAEPCVVSVRLRHSPLRCPCLPAASAEAMISRHVRLVTQSQTLSDLLVRAEPQPVPCAVAAAQTVQVKFVHSDVSTTPTG